MFRCSDKCPRATVETESLYEMRSNKWYYCRAMSSNSGKPSIYFEETRQLSRFCWVLQSSSYVCVLVGEWVVDTSVWLTFTTVSAILPYFSAPIVLKEQTHLPSINLCQFTVLSCISSPFMALTPEGSLAAISFISTACWNWMAGNKESSFYVTVTS